MTEKKLRSGEKFYDFPLDLFKYPMVIYGSKGDIYMGFEFTNLQKKANRMLGMTKVKYRNMYNSEGNIGYTCNGRNCYEINIAQDIESEDVKAVVLIHEVGHIYYGHNDIDFKKEFKTIEGLCYSLGYSPIDLSFYGGYMHFLNIAMDFEVNTKLLTRQNIAIMKTMGFAPCLPQSMDIPFKNSFREYYIPLLERISPEYRAMARALQKGLQSMQDLANAPSGFDSSLTEGEDGLDEESMSVIEDEDYTEGNFKAKEKNLVLVSDVMSEGDSFSRTGTSTVKTTIKEVPADIRISAFLKKLVTHTQVRQNDMIRLYNRRTRNNVPNVLYSSRRLKKEESKKKIAIIVDVSGSMDLATISCALRTLQSLLSTLNKDSCVITWTTSLEQEFPLTKIPELINASGGTDMASALAYVKGKGFSDIVVYSDFCTDINSMMEISKSMVENIHSIVVQEPVTDTLKEYLEMCKSYLVI